MALAVIFDVIVIAALLISSVIAFLRGFIREVLTIIGVIGGLLASYFFGPMLSPKVLEWLNSGREGTEEAPKLFDIIPYSIVADVIAYGSVFLLVVLILSIASHFLASGVKAMGLGAVDRTFGVLFGILRGVVLLAVMYLPAYLMIDKETRAEYLDGSRTAGYVESATGIMAGLMPESMAASLEERAEETKSMAESARESMKELDTMREGIEAMEGAESTEDINKMLQERFPQAEDNAEERKLKPSTGSGYNDTNREQIRNLIEDEAQ